MGALTVRAHWLDSHHINKTSQTGDNELVSVEPCGVATKLDNLVAIRLDSNNVKPEKKQDAPVHAPKGEKSN